MTSYKAKQMFELALEGLIATALNYQERIHEDDIFDSVEAIQEFRDGLRSVLRDECNYVIDSLEVVLEALDKETVY